MAGRVRDSGRAEFGAEAGQSLRGPYRGQESGPVSVNCAMLSPVGRENPAGLSFSSLAGSLASSPFLLQFAAVTGGLAAKGKEKGGER